MTSRTITAANKSGTHTVHRSASGSHTGKSSTGKINGKRAAKSNTSAHRRSSAAFGGKSATHGSSRMEESHGSGGKLGSGDSTDSRH